MIINFDVDKVILNSGFRYNSSEANNDISIEISGSIEKHLSNLDKSIVLANEVSGELTNRPYEENHFMVFLGESVSNFVGYISITESWGNNSEYGVSVYVKPSSTILNFLVNNQDKSYLLKLSAINKTAEATAFSVPRKTMSIPVHPIKRNKMWWCCI